MLLWKYLSMCSFLLLPCDLWLWIRLSAVSEVTFSSSPYLQSLLSHEIPWVIAHTLWLLTSLSAFRLLPQLIRLLPSLYHSLDSLGSFIREDSSGPSHTGLDLLYGHNPLFRTLSWQSLDCMAFLCCLSIIPRRPWASPHQRTSLVTHMVKNLPTRQKAEDPGFMPGLRRSPGEGNCNPLQYSCLENSINRGAWRGMVHGVAKSWTRLSN